MERTAAKEFALGAIQASDKLNEALQNALTLEDKDEWPQFARAVGTIVCDVYEHVLTPIYRQHPGLEREIETELGNPFP